MGAVGWLANRDLGVLNLDGIEIGGKFTGVAADRFCIMIPRRLLDFGPIKTDRVEPVATSFAFELMADPGQRVEVDVLALDT